MSRTVTHQARAHPGYAQPVPVVVRAAPEGRDCGFRGESLTPKERDAAGLDHGRDWRHCLHPARPLGPNVCACTGCSPACPGYEAELPPEVFAPVGRRHLVCHVLPVAGNGVWQRSVDSLRLRWPLFTGHRVFAVATGGPVREQRTGRTLTLDTPAAVRAYLPAGSEVIEVPNRPDRWELQSWPRLWARVLQCGDADAVLYCHAKGVTRPADSPAHRWADALWRLSLDYWPEVARRLRSYPVVGPFTKVGPFGTKTGVGTGLAAWHYSGNFWWARAVTMRAKLAAVPVPQDPWGCEAWPGIAFRPDEAGSLLGDVTPGLDLYRPENLARLDALLARWQAAHPPTPVTSLAPPPGRPAVGPVTVSVVVATCGRPSLARTLASITPQLGPGDEVVVVRDGTGDSGNTPRNDAMRRCRGSHLLFLDDDDLSIPGALDAVRRAAAAHPGKVLLFRMRRGAPHNDLVPHDGVNAPRLGEVSTQTVCVPNDPDRLGVWGGGGEPYAGDWDFVRTTLAMYPPDGWVQLPEVIAQWNGCRG